MQHIRFIANNQTVCWAPERLDAYDSAVVIDPESEDSCRECTALLMAHNQRESEKETRHRIQGAPRPESNMGCIRGAVYGVGVLAVFWCVIALLTWVITR